MAAEEASIRASGASRALRSRIANATELGGAAARRSAFARRSPNGGRGASHVPAGDAWRRPYSSTLCGAECRGAVHVPGLPANAYF